MTRYDLDLAKCCFCGLCAEQCPTGALQHTAQYELSFYSRKFTLFDKDQMVRSGEGSRATGRDSDRGAGSGPGCRTGGAITEDSAPINPEDLRSGGKGEVR